MDQYQNAISPFAGRFSAKRDRWMSSASLIHLARLAFATTPGLAYLLAMMAV